MIYAAFSIIERGDNFFIDESTIMFSTHEPIGADFYVKNKDYPKVFDPENPSFSRTYYHPTCPFSQWRFDVDKYNKGLAPFILFDPSVDPVFQASLRRGNMVNSITNAIPLMTELKNCRLLINEIFNVLIREGIVQEKPDSLENWNDTLESIKAMYPKIGESENYKENLVHKLSPIDPSMPDPEAVVRESAITEWNDLSKIRLKDAKKNKGMLKNYEKVVERMNKRKERENRRKNINKS